MNNDTRIPNKVISIKLTDVISGKKWQFDDGSMFWEGGSDPKPYQWTIELEVTPQNHSCELTREPMEYNGLDIFVDDYIVEGTTGNVFKIISIDKKTETSITCIVEDTYRYNIFKDSSQTGNSRPSSGGYALFQLSEEGMPLLDPYPANNLPIKSLASITSGRFRRFNTSRRIDVTEPGHTFVNGDIISVTEQGYEFTTSNNASSSFGKIIDVDTDNATFGIITNNKLISNTELRLPGQLGSFLYVDETLPGRLTSNKNGPALYLRVTPQKPSISSSSNVTDSLGINAIGDVLNINTIDVHFTGTSIESIVSDINELSSQHGVVASETFASTIATSNLSDAEYGGIFVGVPGGTATINNVTVSFTSTDSGGSYGNATDVATDINSANIPNLIASSVGSNVQLVETTGGTITIVNETPDAYGNPVCGPNSATGLPLATPASTDTFLKLTHPDGFPITLKNVVGTPMDDLGLTSVDNGSPVYLMPVSGGVAKSEGTIVVPDMAGRDNLDTPTVGQLVYVVDADDGNGNNVGDWSMFVWDGDKWILTADEDSAATDANSSKLELTNVSSGSNHIVTMSEGSRVTIITVEVETPFTDITSSIDIHGQDSNGIVTLMGNDMIDLSSTGTYTTTTDTFFASGGDVDITALLVAGSSTDGNVIITISYQ